MAVLHRPLFSPRLIHHLNSMFETVNPSDIVDAERRAYALPMLSVPYLRETIDKITDISSREISSPMGLMPQQLALPL